MTELWRNSLLFRRAVAGGVLLVAALLVYFAANIPQPVSLPYEDVNKLAAAHFGEELRIYKPKLGDDDAILSYEGAPNELAEVWLDHAEPVGVSKAMLAGATPQAPGPVTYTIADPANLKGQQHCRTTVVVRHGNGTPAPKEIDLAQRDPESGQQQFRQILLRSPGSVLQLEVHTDSDVEGPSGLTLCPRLVSVGTSKMILPAGPLYLSVPGGWVNLRFFSADPIRSAFSEDHSTLDNVSLGEDGLQASGLDIVSAKVSKTPILHVQAHRGSDGVTLHGLKIAAKEIGLEVGKAMERADCAAKGTRIGPLNLPELIQKNLVLSALAAGAIAALLKWEGRIFFPEKPQERDEPKKKRSKRKVPSSTPS